MSDSSNINIIQHKVGDLYLGVSAHSNYGGMIAQMDVLRAICHYNVCLGDDINYDINYGIKAIIGNFLGELMQVETGGGVHAFVHQEITDCYRESDDNDHGFLVIDFINDQIVLFEYDVHDTVDGVDDMSVNPVFPLTPEGAREAWTLLYNNVLDVHDRRYAAEL